MESGVSAILIHEDKILLQLRDNKLDISYPNFWGLKRQLRERFLKS